MGISKKQPREGEKNLSPAALEKSPDFEFQQEIDLRAKQIEGRITKVETQIRATRELLGAHTGDLSEAQIADFSLQLEGLLRKLLRLAGQVNTEMNIPLERREARKTQFEEQVKELVHKDGVKGLGRFDKKRQVFVVDDEKDRIEIDVRMPDLRDETCRFNVGREGDNIKLSFYYTGYTLDILYHPDSHAFEVYHSRKGGVVTYEGTHTRPDDLVNVFQRFRDKMRGDMGIAGESDAGEQRGDEEAESVQHVEKISVSSARKKGPQRGKGPASEDDARRQARVSAEKAREEGHERAVGPAKEKQPPVVIEGLGTYDEDEGFLRFEDAKGMSLAIDGLGIPTRIDIDDKELEDGTIEIKDLVFRYPHGYLLRIDFDDRWRKADGRGYYGEEKIFNYSSDATPDTLRAIITGFVKEAEAKSMTYDLPPYVRKTDLAERDEKIPADATSDIRIAVDPGVKELNGEVTEAQKRLLDRALVFLQKYNDFRDAHEVMWGVKKVILVPSRRHVASAEEPHMEAAAFLTERGILRVSVEELTGARNAYELARAIDEGLRVPGKREERREAIIQTFRDAFDVLSSRHSPLLQKIEDWRVSTHFDDEVFIKGGIIFLHPELAYDPDARGANGDGKLRPPRDLADEIESSAQLFGYIPYEVEKIQERLKEEKRKREENERRVRVREIRAERKDAAAIENELKDRLSENWFEALPDERERVRGLEGRIRALQLDRADRDALVGDIAQLSQLLLEIEAAGEAHDEKKRIVNVETLIHQYALLRAKVEDAVRTFVRGWGGVVIRHVPPTETQRRQEILKKRKKEVEDWEKKENRGNIRTFEPKKMIDDDIGNSVKMAVAISDEELDKAARERAAEVKEREEQEGFARSRTEVRESVRGMERQRIQAAKQQLGFLEREIRKVSEEDRHELVQRIQSLREVVESENPPLRRVEDNIEQLRDSIYSAVAAVRQKAAKEAAAKDRERWEQTKQEQGRVREMLAVLKTDDPETFGNITDVRVVEAAVEGGFAIKDGVLLVGKGVLYDEKGMRDAGELTKNARRVLTKGKGEEEIIELSDIVDEEPALSPPSFPFVPEVDAGEPPPPPRPPKEPATRTPPREFSAVSIPKEPAPPQQEVRPSAEEQVDQRTADDLLQSLKEADSGEYGELMQARVSDEEMEDGYRIDPSDKVLIINRKFLRDI